MGREVGEGVGGVVVEEEESEEPVVVDALAAKDWDVEKELVDKEREAVCLWRIDLGEVDSRPRGLYVTQCVKGNFE